jgi:hypothetical protein
MPPHAMPICVWLAPVCREEREEPAYVTTAQRCNGL